MTSQNHQSNNQFDHQNAAEPMPEDVASMLSALCQAAGKSFKPDLTLSEALIQIDVLRNKLDIHLLSRSGLAANLPGKVTSSRAMSSDGSK